jgi:hypothetical protein
VTENREVPDLDLLEVDSEASVSTIHVLTSPGEISYRLIFRVRDQNKHVISATLINGPNVMVPMDLANLNTEGAHLATTIDVLAKVPQGGDTYTLQVNYSDGTSDVQYPGVTAVLDDFVQNPAPSDPNAVVAVGTNVAPQFTWDAPANLPANYEYLFTLQGGDISQTAQLDQDTHYLWPGPNLSLDGTTYTWRVIVRDTDTGNETEVINTYTPAP